MKKIIVIYHSGYGHTEVIAKAVAEGANTDQTESQLIKISPEGQITDEEWEALDQADAIIMGAPTYMGTVSGPFKMWQDQTSKPWFARKWLDKIGGGFTTSSNMSGNKESTLKTIMVLAMQQGMIWAGTGTIGNIGEDDMHRPNPENANRLGAYIGVMSQAGNADPKETPPAGDKKFGRQYGERIAKITTQFKRG